MVTLLHITGWGRSGSTLLGNMLGSMPGFTHVGEVQWVWQRGVVENGLCGCGQPFHACATWRSIFEEAYGVGSIEEVEGARVARLIREAPQNRDVASYWAARKVGRRRGGEAKPSEELVARLQRLYGAIQSVTGARVVVDSSKTPSYAFLLGRVPGVDVFVLHLVRDARACAHSWMQEVRRADGEGALMERFPPLAGTLKWGFANVVSEFVGGQRSGRYLRVRYEDVVAAPSQTVGRVLGLLGEPGGLSLSGEPEFTAGVQHTAWGNPSRLKTGPIRLRLDDRWRREMPPAVASRVTLLSWPLLHRYGYAPLH